MSLSQKQSIVTTIDTHWRRLRTEHRTSIVGCLALTALALLYSLFAAAAQNSETSVQFEVVTGTGFTMNMTAIPEKRIPASGNDGTRLTVEVRNIGNPTPLFSQTVTTSSGGTYSGLTVTLATGTYDVTAKGYSHLRVKKTNQHLTNNVTVDFTAAGTSPLLSGDVNATYGDNKVNGIDLSQIVTGLTSYDVRYDLNRDTRVNGIDLTNAVSNLNQVGAN